ncbi:polysaccharide pyruvyl transferase family protein [Gayadomonas joobiniege]|uniref:polysaccharide pyruvyl transferase family protein n=1 Tax=Gayadomonas joobiniege TaxID=1234606 RepID=UPI000380F3A0|nr:polysaccharide pyruvyl transferase family protein [Gayadomonas joobiniege]
MKKIGILTQPLANNYGGLLQAFALQRYLVKQGHNVLTVDLVAKHYQPTLNQMLKAILANIVRRYILRKPLKKLMPRFEENKAYVGKNTRRFVAEYINTTQKLMGVDELNYLDGYNFDAVVVGSDQVWRPAYSPGIESFFLSHLANNSDIKKVSYAASFGVDHCNEYTQSQLAECSAALHKFDGVSVREDSGVELCKEHFGVQATHVIDPTMLLDPSDYIELIEKDKIKKSNGNMMVYVLDKSQEKRNMIAQVVSEKELNPYTIILEGNNPFPPVTEWLRGFMDAEYVVTDSFHGVVFSILFNKPFIAIGNEGRGLSRFTSVLKVFGLESRLVLTHSDLTSEKINSPIDYEKVNEIREAEKQKAAVFLRKSIGF